MKKTRGLSLVEVLIGITIVGIMGSLLVNLLVSSNSVFFNQSVRVSNGLSLNQTAREITSLIRSSAGIASQYPVTGAPQYTTDQNTLVLKFPAISQSGSVVNQAFDFVVITKDQIKPAILRQITFVDSLSSRKAQNKVLSTTLKSLRFIYLDVNNSPVSAAQAARINFIINLNESTGSPVNEGSASGTANLKD